MSFSVCSFSGHRIISRMHTESLPILLSSTIEDFLSSGIRVFQSGGALGFDLLAAEHILSLRDSGEDVFLRMLLPCRDQAARWPLSSRRRYENILQRADEVKYISEKYDMFCMHLRNRALVDTADVLLCYMLRENSGTAHTVNYANDRSVSVVNLAALL